MTNQYNIVLIGPMGAGKTSIGKALARTMGWEFFDSDQEIEDRAGVDLLWIYDLEGESGFHKREQKVIADLMQKKNIILATGGSTVVVPENRQAICRSGIVIYLSTSLDDQFIRTGLSKKRPLAREASARRDTLKRFRDECVPLYEDLADIIYSTGNQSAQNAVSDLIKLIKEQKPGFF
jgi:shikimate kinase